MQWWLTIASIRLAVVCLVFYLLSRCFPGSISIQQHNASESNRVRPFSAWLKYFWLGGAIASLVHVIASYGYVHEWSHLDAVNRTAEQTRELTGISVGYGIYFNYLFVIVWFLDAVWMMTSETSYLRRNRKIDYFVFGYLIFIAFNGAVVFASGWFRWFSAALFLILLIAFILGKKAISLGEQTKNSS